MYDLYWVILLVIAMAISGLAGFIAGRDCERKAGVRLREERRNAKVRSRREQLANRIRNVLEGEFAQHKFLVVHSRIEDGKAMVRVGDETEANTMRLVDPIQRALHTTEVLSVEVDLSSRKLDDVVDFSSKYHVGQRDEDDFEEIISMATEVIGLHLADRAT